MKYVHETDGDKLAVTASTETPRTIKYDTHNTGSEDMLGHMDDSFRKRTLFQAGACVRVCCC